MFERGSSANGQSYWTQEARVGDVNGDGRPDFVTSGDGFRVRFGQAGGGLAAAVFTPVESGDASGVDRFALGDINGDGHLDVVGCLEQFFKRQVLNGCDARVWLGDGSGAFIRNESASYFLVNTRDIALLDANGDGRDDLVVATGDPTLVPPYGLQFVPTGGVVVFVADGVGGFGPVDPATGLPTSVIVLLAGHWASGLAVGDLNDDGRGDLVASVDASFGASPGLWRFVRNGVGSGFAAPGFTSGSTDVTPMQVVDVTGDGQADVIGYDTGSAQIAVGNGTGGLAAPVLVGAIPSPAAVGTLDGHAVASAVYAGDVNLDGHMDVVVGSKFVPGSLGGGSLGEPALGFGLWLGQGGTAFAPGGAYANTRSVDDVAVLDATRDGRADVVFVSPSSGQGTNAANFLYIYEPIGRGPRPPIPAEQTRGNGAGFLAGSDDLVEFAGQGVNTLTGAAAEDATDLTLSGVGVGFSVDRSYNSDDATVGPFGAGWTWGLGIRATGQVNGDVVVRDGNGSSARFVQLTGGGFGAPVGVRASLVARAGGGWVLGTPDQESLAFDATGRVLSILDRDGLGLSFAYTGAVLSSVTDGAGRVVVFTYTAGRVTRVLLPDGRHSDYTYTAAGRMSRATDGSGSATSYTYNTGGRLATVKDALNRTVRTLVYDGSGRVTDESGAALKHTLFAWDPLTQTTSVTDALGAVSRDVYDGNVIVQQVDSGGRETTYGRDNGLSRAAKLTPGGQVYSAVNDANGNQERVVDPSGGVGTATYDQKNNPLTVTDRLGNTTTNTYDANGRLATSTNALGGVRVLTYTATGKLATTSDEAGGVTTYSYDAAGNRTGVTTPGGKSSTSTYDPSGHLLTSTDPRGKTTTFEYNTRDQVTKVTDPAGGVTITVYDAAGRKTSVTGPTGAVTSWTYDTSGRVTAVTDPRGGITRTVYDAAGNVASTTSATAAKTTYTYDGEGRVATMTRPIGNRAGQIPAAHTWSYTYDADGNEITRSFPGIGTTSTTYDEQSRVTAVTDPLGRMTRTEYDAEGRVSARVDPGGRRTETTYDALGRAVSTKDPLGHVTTTEFDALGRRTARVTALGNRTTWTYDPDGRVTSVVDPRGNTVNQNPDDYKTTFTYDQAGNPTQAQDPLGHQTTTSYDNAGRTVGVTDANGNVTGYGYDLAGRLTSVTGADAPACGPGTAFDPPPAWCVNAKLSTVYTLDPVGNVTARTDPNGHTTTTALDLDNRPTLVTGPIAQKWSYTYDANGNQVTKTTARGNAATNPATGRVTSTYDAAGRRTKVTYPGTTTPDVTLTYDSLDRRTSILDGTGTTTITYGLAGNITSVDRGASGGAFTYTYDATGNPLTRTRPDGSTITAAYSDEGRLTQITGPTGTFAFAYDPAGNLTQTVLPPANGYQETRGYDRAGRLTSVSSEKGGAILSRFTRTLDPTGNTTRIDTLRGTTTTSNAYTYTPAKRLQGYCPDTTTCTGATDAVTWSYDPVGNRLTQTRSGTNAGLPPTVAYTYNPGDQLTQTVTTTPGAPITTGFTYDADGNQTTVGAATNVYDLENRLVTATRGTAVNRYTYTGDGLRYQRKLGTAIQTTWSWDTVGGLPELALEKNAVGAVTRSYLQGPTGPLTETTTTGTAFLHHDLIGSTSDATSPTGTPTYAYQYHPYGEQRTRSVLQAAAVEPTQRFTGETLDTETGLYHQRARQYDPATGLFTATDPLQPNPRNPAASTYTYADNQPLDLTDPTGLITSAERAALCRFNNQRGKAFENLILRSTLEPLFGAENIAQQVTLRNSGGCARPDFLVRTQAANALAYLQLFSLSIGIPDYVVFEAKSGLGRLTRNQREVAARSLTEGAEVRGNNARNLVLFSGRKLDPPLPWLILEEDKGRRPRWVVTPKRILIPQIVPVGGLSPITTPVSPPSLPVCCYISPPSAEQVRDAGYAVAVAAGTALLVVVALLD